MRPSSFCTICTHTCYNELIGLLLSLSIHHKGSTIYCMVDTKTSEEIMKIYNVLRVNVVFVVSLDKYYGMNRKEMEQRNIWREFQNTKGLVMQRALEDFEDTLFLDSDILVVNPIDCIDKSKKIGLSPHYIRKKDTDRYGYYNGGVAWTSCKDMPNKWRKYTLTSRYYDQASLEDVKKEYEDSYFEFGKECNFSWWRVFQSDEKPNDILKHIIIKEGKNVFYDNTPLRFIHTHFNNITGVMGKFNELMISALIAAKKCGEVLCIERMANNTWNIGIPKQPQPNLWSHTNDSFRELAIMISEYYNDVVITESPDGHVRLGNFTVLYDRPNKNWFTKSLSKAGCVLIGNGSMNDEHKVLQSIGAKTQSWIFWPRNPRHYNAYLTKHTRKSYNERTIESIFIGNIENGVQNKYRTRNDWTSVISEYHCTKGSGHKFNKEEYVSKLADSRFGLCLRGFGSKCHREVELMGVGTIPIITPGVSLDYHDKLIEDTHYIKVSSPDELSSKISNINPEKWNSMSKSCYEWYKRNISVVGAWQTTLKQVLYN